MKTYTIHTNNGKTFKIRGDVLDLTGNDGVLTIQLGGKYIAFFSIQNIAFIAESEFIKTSK